MRANETYSEAKSQISVRDRDVLMKALSLYEWWSTLKSAVVNSSSLLPPLIGEGGGQLYEVGKADLLSDHLPSIFVLSPLPSGAPLVRSGTS